MGRMIAGKLFYGLVCLLAAVLLVVSGFAHKVVGLTTMASRSRAPTWSPTQHRGLHPAGARQIAIQFGTAATSLSALPAGHVEVLIGSAVTQVPAGIASSSTPSAGTQSAGARVIGARAAAGQPATPTPSSTAMTGGSGTGGSVTTAPNAPYGIPCVY